MADASTVALQVRGPAVSEGSNALNPIQMMEGVARINNMMNQNLLFHQEFAAKTRLGEIMASAPSAEEGFNSAMRDPIAAPFATQAFSNFRTGMLAQRQYNESLGKDAASALESITKATPQAFIDPDGYKGYVQARFAMLPKDVQEQARTGFNYYTTSIFGGLDALPKEQQAAEIQKRVTAAAIGSGSMDPDKIRGLNGFPAPGTEQVQLPDGRTVPMTRVQPLGGPGYLQPLDIPGTGSPTPAPVSVTGGAQPQPGAGPGAGSLVTPQQAAAGGTTPPAPPVVATPVGGAQPGGAQPGPGQVQPGQPGRLISPGLGQTTEQKELATKGAENVKAIYDEIDASANAIPVMANRMNALQDALKEFPAGGWATGRNQVATFMQGLGRALQIDPHTMDDLNKKITGGEMSQQQVFHALISQYAIQQLKDVAQGTGRVMKSEVDGFLAQISENTDPRAVEILLNTQGRRMLQIAADKVQKFAPYMRAAEQGLVTGVGLDGKTAMSYKPQDYYNWYGSQSLDVNKLPTNFGGYDLSPRDISEAKGVKEMQGPARGTYNPTTGKFE